MSAVEPGDTQNGMYL